MTDSLAIDCAFPMNYAQVKAEGYKAVIRYLSSGELLGGQPKDLSDAERNAIHAEGLGIGLVWETSGARAASGHAAGAADGAAAVAEAKRLGVPAGTMLLANLGDFAAAAGQIEAIHLYYEAFHNAAGFDFQRGGYATGYIIDELVKAGAQGIWWQNAMDDSGVPGATVSPHASIYQRVKPTTRLGGSFDEDLYGFGPAEPSWWMAGAAPRPPAPIPAPVPQPKVTIVSAELVVHYSDGTQKTLSA